MAQMPPKSTLMVGGSVLMLAGLHRLWQRRKKVAADPSKPEPATMEQQGQAWIGAFLVIAGIATLVAGLRW